ncbi:MAG: hypothetical protein GHCLOJNM_03981 [bacterium]|nr:hypothetical protein [bacterium]
MNASDIPTVERESRGGEPSGETRRARSFFRTLLKTILLVLGIPVLLVILGILFVVGVYWNVVRVSPGGLGTAIKAGERGALVNPFIGTGGVPWVCAYNSPGATLPFGMVRLAPDTASILVDQQCLSAAGYYFGDNKIVGFSHTRLLGADALEGGHFRITPAMESGVESACRKERFARFSHREETAFPGYYAVRLPDEEILVELTATTRVGVHRYTFGGKERPHLLLDVTSSLGDVRTESGTLRILPEAREIEGSVRTFGSFARRYGGLDVYFVARFDRPFADHGVWTGDRFSRDQTEGQGARVGADLCFAWEGTSRVVEARVALSYVSVENARANLEAEAGGAEPFEEVFMAARDAWEDRLARIRVEGGTERERRIFHTALYRAFQMPTTFTDVNGEYRGFDKQVHRAEGFQYYTDFSLWDTFRTVHPLYNLIAREDARDMMVSLVEMASAGGGLPRWPAGCGYTNCMMGTPADMAVTEAYLKGIRDFDVRAAYDRMRHTALVGRPEGSRFSGREGLDWRLKLGYCPSDKMSEAVSKDLEYAYADHSLSLLARELGEEEDAARFEENSRSYRHLWNPETQYFQPRDSQGRFFAEFRPLALSYTDSGRKYTDDYVEGSALQWRWGVPWDPEDLVTLFKSKEYFVNELNAFFEGSRRWVGWWHPGSHYWHGNEPDLHAVYLFNAAGRPDLTQKWVRALLEAKYSDGPVGLDGNDDGGTLSAWYVFSALGFYPIAGTTRYEIGSPLFERAEIDMGALRILEVIVENTGPDNVYVEAVHLNDVPLEEHRFTHDAIRGGGTLRFKMRKQPTGN